MITEELWQHICDARVKAYYLIAKLPRDQHDNAATLVEAIDVIYNDYRKVFE